MLRHIDDVPLAMQEMLFSSLSRIIREYIAKNTVYGENGAVQFARKAAHHALEWHPELRDPDR